jgi:hypothetical protein
MTQQSNPITELILVLSILVFVAWISCLHGISQGIKQEQKRAIESGAAKYIVNEKTGETEFVYGK